MDENEFIEKLSYWQIKERPAIIPTSGKVLLYGDHQTNKIVLPQHEYLIYACVDSMKMSDELFKELTEKKKFTELQCLQYVQENYMLYLKSIKKKIVKIQKAWSKNFCHNRAKMIFNHLDYKDVYFVCDLVNDRLVPIELILRIVFDKSSKYGDHREFKKREDVYVDPRVLKVYKELQEYNSRTTIHPKKL